MSEASILQLLIKGKEDDYFLKNPSLFYFNMVYKKYVNFSIENSIIPPINTANFGKKIVFDIPKKGDLLSDLHLHIKLPRLVKTSGTYLSWSDSLGYAIFDNDYINFEIDGVVLEKLYPRYMDIERDFTSGVQKDGLGLMLNKSDIYLSSKTNADRIYDLIIPLQFFFTKKYNTALPISSFDYNNMRVSFSLKSFKKVINFDGIEPTYDVDILDCSMYAEYVYFESDFLKKFKKEKHEFIIEQVQYISQNIPTNSVINNIKLDFENPVKEIILATCLKSSIDTNNYFVYQDENTNSFVDKITMSFNGKPKFDRLPEFIYRTIFPMKTHTNIPLKYIYCIPFSLIPEKTQPSGYLNFSKISNPTITLEMKQNTNETVVFIYALSMNILSINDNSFNLLFFS